MVCWRASAWGAVLEPWSVLDQVGAVCGEQFGQGFAEAAQAGVAAEAERVPVQRPGWVCGQQVFAGEDEPLSAGALFRVAPDVAARVGRVRCGDERPGRAEKLAQRVQVAQILGFESGRGSFAFAGDEGAVV